jgi:hypothetical protein
MPPEPDRQTLSPKGAPRRPKSASESRVIGFRVLCSEPRRPKSAWEQADSQAGRGWLAVQGQEVGARDAGRCKWQMANGKCVMCRCTWCCAGSERLAVLGVLLCRKWQMANGKCVMCRCRRARGSGRPAVPRRAAPKRGAGSGAAQRSPRRPGDEYLSVCLPACLSASRCAGSGAAQRSPGRPGDDCLSACLSVCLSASRCAGSAKRIPFLLTSS